MHAILGVGISANSHDDKCILLNIQLSFLYIWPNWYIMNLKVYY